jgi:hypothetical protein
MNGDSAGQETLRCYYRVAGIHVGPGFSLGRAVSWNVDFESTALRYELHCEGDVLHMSIIEPRSKAALY